MRKTYIGGGHKVKNYTVVLSWESTNVYTVYDWSSEYYGSFEQLHFPQSFAISSGFSGVYV